MLMSVELYKICQLPKRIRGDCYHLTNKHFTYITFQLKYVERIPYAVGIFAGKGQPRDKRNILQIPHPTRSRLNRRIKIMRKRTRLTNHIWVQFGFNRTNAFTENTRSIVNISSRSHWWHTQKLISNMNFKWSA